MGFSRRDTQGFGFALAQLCCGGTLPKAQSPKPNYGFTATISGLQVIGTVPVPFCPVSETPNELVTVKVPVPSALMVKVPMLPGSFIPATTTVWPNCSAGPE